MDTRNEQAWVTDTSVYTHLCRAGHAAILEFLAPGGVILVPSDVHVEINQGREDFPGIPDVASTPWAQLTILTEEEYDTQLAVKAAMGGGATDHLGECAVIACAKHRGLVALIDERAAIAVADQHGVTSHDTLWLVIEAYCSMPGFDRARAEQAVDDLAATGMYLPIGSGASLLAWAYEEELLPRDPAE